MFTPTYNRAGTLPRVYESLRAQTYRDFEWLVIDDGSSDGTAEMVLQWAKQATFPIKYFYQENSGKAAAWNRAVIMASGEYFVCLDSDDACRPEALSVISRHMALLDRTQCSGISTLVMDHNGAPYGPDLPGAPFNASPPAVTFAQRHPFEKWDCHVTEILRMFPFELIAGYQGYLPESTIQNKMATQYQHRYFNDRLRYYHVGTLSGASTGHLSVGAKRDTVHARGIRFANLAYLRYQSQWAAKAPMHYLKLAANYARFSLLEGIGPISQWREICSKQGRLIWLAGTPVGYILYFRDRLRTAGIV